jgi:hypothetical protein
MKGTDHMKTTKSTRQRVHTALGWVLGCAVVLTMVMPMAATAQVTLRPAPRPVVTAENERWYLEGQPITFGGDIYYPTGPTVFFNPYEMVRSGDFRGIPLYAMKTREPYEAAYVPLAGGLMQPYERRREGDLAGTVGSTAPSFPVDRDSEPTPDDAFLQAAGPPVLREFYPSYGDSVTDTTTTPVRPAAGPAETTSEFSRPAGPLTTALKPTGLNAFYIDYKGRRWFSSGPTVLLDSSSFTSAGEYYGFPVYVAKDQQTETIYVPVASAARELLTPYSTRK